MVNSTFLVKETDCNKAGFIKYPKYVEWINTAKHDFLTQRGYSMKELEDKGINLVTVYLNLRCMAPALKGDEIKVDVALDNGGSQTLNFSYTAKNKKNKVVFKAESMMAPIDNHANLSIFPAEFLSRISSTGAVKGSISLDHDTSF